MLARGAACDTCRARKVKCDALRPFCSPCLKSARGDSALAESKCKYEGTSVAAAREAAAAAAVASGATMGVGMGGKRKRAGQGAGAGQGGGKKRETAALAAAAAVAAAAAAAAQEEEDEDDDPDAMVRGEKRGRLADSYAGAGGQLPLPPHLQQQQQQQGHYPHQQQQPPYAPQSGSSYYDAAPPPPSSSSAYAAQTPHHPHHPPGVVEELTGRVAQLERQLQQQADAHAAQLSSASASAASSAGAGAPFNPYAQAHPHTRSPSFPYGAGAGAYPPPPGSAGGGSFQLPPLASALPLNPPGFDLQPGAPPRSAGGSLLPPLSAGGGDRPGTAGGGMFAYPTPSLSASAPGSGGPSSAHSASSSSFALPPYPYPSANGAPSSGFSPRPLTASGLSAGARTPLPSLSALASAAGAAAGAAGAGEFGFPLLSGATWSPGSGVAESNLRGGGAGTPAPLAAGGAGGMAAPSPMSSLRRLVASSSGSGEGEARGESAQAQVESPRGSLWGITGNGAAGGAGAGAGGKGYAVVDTSASGSAGSAGTTPATEALSNAVSPLDPLHDPLSALFSTSSASYPSSFPPPRTLLLLLNAFFLRATLPASMLDRASILRAVEVLGPADREGWPDEALVHAMCAYGAFFVSGEGLEGAEDDASVGEGLGLDLDGTEAQEEKGEGEAGAGEKKKRTRRAPYWMRAGDASAIAYHYRMGKRSVEEATMGGMSGGRAGGGGRDMFQVLQSTILLCYTAYLTCAFTDLWLLSGTATRLCTPLGLSHLDAWNFERGRCGPAGEDWGVRVRFVERRELMSSPRTLDEHWRRSVTFWLAFAVDRWASASTDWSTSIDEKDISTHLPCAAPMPMPSLVIDRRTGQIPSLSISSPTFLEDVSAPIGPLGLYIKATVLLGRVVNFLQRLPRARCVDAGGTCAEIKAALKATPEFIELDVALMKFKASHSANFYDQTGSHIDGFRTSAYVIPHVATILLHEPFTDRLDQSSTSSLARCLSAAKCVVNSMFVLYQSSYDLGGCDPFLPFCWSTTGRALVRDWATRRRWTASFADGNVEATSNYVEEAEASKGLAEHCLSFMRTCERAGSGIAAAQAEALQRHLDDPDALLPFDGSESWAVSAYLEPL
ncbi:hypothetical protein JCM6882_008740 [Rhodosporidiobolus microsporus]